ncbi:MAG: hypothetical protein R2851_16750 [Caldilineaceae bacterium]
MEQPWLDLYGGKISSEWFFSKALQILDEAPEVYAAADRLIRATGLGHPDVDRPEARSSCANYGYLAEGGGLSQQGFPGRAPSRPGRRGGHQAVARTILPLGAKAGELTPQAAAWTGLQPGTAVAVANVDAHVTVPAAQAVDPGVMVMIMGTSTCHMVNATKRKEVPGMCGVVEDDVLPGLFGFTNWARAAWAISSPGSSKTGCRPSITRKPSAKASIFMLCWKRGAPETRRKRSARAGLVERQPLHPGGCGPERLAHRRHAGLRPRSTARSSRPAFDAL